MRRAFVLVQLILLIPWVVNAEPTFSLTSFSDMPFEGDQRPVAPPELTSLDSLYKIFGQPTHTESKKYWKSDNPKDLQITLEYPEMVVVYLFINDKKQYWRIGWQLRIRGMKLSGGIHSGMTQAEILKILGEPTWTFDHPHGKELIYDTFSSQNVGFYFENGRLTMVNITSGL